MPRLVLLAPRQEVNLVEWARIFVRLGATSRLSASRINSAPRRCAAPFVSPCCCPSRLKQDDRYGSSLSTTASTLARRASMSSKRSCHSSAPARSSRSSSLESSSLLPLYSADLRRSAASCAWFAHVQSARATSRTSRPANSLKRANFEVTSVRPDRASGAIEQTRALASSSGLHTTKSRRSPPLREDRMSACDERSVWGTQIRSRSDSACAGVRGSPVARPRATARQQEMVRPMSAG